MPTPRSTFPRKLRGIGREREGEKKKKEKRKKEKGVGAARLEAR